MSQRILSIVSVVFGFIIFLSMYYHHKELVAMPQKIENMNDVLQLFNCDAVCIKQRADDCFETAKQKLQDIVAIPAQQRTFDNTMVSFDKISAEVGSLAALAQTLEMVSLDAAIRDAAHQVMVQVQAFIVDYFKHNVPLYKALMAYIQENRFLENLTEEQNYYLDEVLKDFKREGLDLPLEQQEKLKVLRKELGALELQFDAHINADNKMITVNKDDLIGLQDDFIAALPHTGDVYQLGTDYPTYMQVMENCSVSSTRKALWLAFMNRAYPQNDQVLQQVIMLRNKLAHLLGYKSYAHMNIDDSMAKSVDRVEEFLNDLAQRVSEKVAVEMAELHVDLPDGVALTDKNQFLPWDLAYVKSSYKKKHLKIDERVIAEYFPLGTTIERLFAIYQEFFNITFVEEQPAGFWHQDVRLITVKSNDGHVLGYLLLDLHPRPYKYTHACEIGIIKAHTNADGTTTPAVAVVLANFPKNTGSRPALLPRQDVITFFHEFGHAIHELFGATDMYGFAGTSVKRDFVEMPSQMLEEWMWDEQILKRVSSHYLSGEPLSDIDIDRIRALKKFDAGDFVQRQIFLSMLSLDYFTDGAEKNINSIKERLSKKLRPYVALVPEEHFEASFGHLMGYGAGYYGYLWSRVYALDLFEHIKHYGLLDPNIGAQYVANILSRGGSADPETLLINFLGRKPRSDAFFKDMGL